MHKMTYAHDGGSLTPAISHLLMTEPSARCRGLDPVYAAAMERMVGVATEAKTRSYPATLLARTRTDTDCAGPASAKRRTDGEVESERAQGCVAHDHDMRANGVAIDGAIPASGGAKTPSLAATALGKRRRSIYLATWATTRTAAAARAESAPD
jgi:hypothetical protein